jgi:hypothetical protein
LGAATAGLGAAGTAADFLATGGAEGGAGAGFAGGGDIGGGGVSTAPETFGATAGTTVAPSAPTAPTSLGGAASPSDVLSGQTGPLSSLTSPDIGGEFAQVPGQSSIIGQPNTLAPGTLGIEDVQGTPIQSFAGTTETGFPAGTDTSGLSAIQDALSSGYGGPQIGENFTDLTPAGTAAGPSQPLSMALASETPSLPASTPSLDTLAATGPAGQLTPTNISAVAGAPGAAPAAAAAPGGGGISGTLSSILSSPITKTAEIAAPLGMLGYTLASGPAGLPPAMEQALSNLGPVQNLARTDLRNAAANKITPAQTAQIATYKQNATNQLYQFYASQGRNPLQDTDYIQGVEQINQNAIAMQQQFIDAMVTEGIQAQGAVSSELNAAANLQVANDNAFNQSISSALQSFGLVAALSTAGTKVA